MIRSLTAPGGGSYRCVHAEEHNRNGGRHRGSEYDPNAYQHIPEDDHGDPASLHRFSSWPDLDSSHRGRHELHDDPFLHSVSREGSLPLSHPTPDLQSLQGAYVGNVERLEMSAERLSLGSDIGEELRKLQMEQKRSESGRSSLRAAPSRQYSSNSHTNSIRGYNSVARSGGFSHEGYVTSPNSIRSPSWSLPSTQEHFPGHKLSEPSQEGKPLDSPISLRSSVRMVAQMPSPEEEETHNEGNLGQDGEEEGNTDLQRNTSIASADTFQRASAAFADFDGVHISSDLTPPEPVEPVEPVELEETGPAEQTGHPEQLEQMEFAPRHEELGNSIERNLDVSPAYSASVIGYEAPRSGPNMVYYPAPVPAMLNLPQKLSKRPPASKIEQRRTQLLSKTKSTASLDGLLENGSEGNDKLPPQLRATMYFEHPSISHDLEIEGGSAVATLDRLLDAAADAPVSAFTDHPIIGQVGAEVYSRSRDPRQSRITINQTNHRQSSADPARRSFIPFGGMRKRMTAGSKLAMRDDGDACEEGTEDDDDAERAELQLRTDDREEADEADDIDTDRPTTLLAELQMRKQQQQKRNRTAANAFPDGMRSTLLQLDAVAQIQKQSRKHKHVTLAWEEQGEEEAGDDENDEVPLGMLYPNGKPSPNDAYGRFDEDRPLGLLAQRTMEDNEPLSARRARLRGEPIPSPNAVHERQTSMFNLELPGVTTDAVSDEEEETLAQRKQRLGKKGPELKTRRISGDFASEVLSQFGVGEVQTAEKSKTPDPEETLGQRRKRLQAEKLQSGQASSEAASGQRQSQTRKRTSMADLLQAHPLGDQKLIRHTLPARGLVGSNTWQPSTLKDATHQAQRHQTFGPSFYSPTSGAHIGQPAQYVNPMTYTPMMGLHNPPGVGPQLPNLAPMADHLPLDPRQRALIDRWRQSVL